MHAQIETVNNKISNLSKKINISTSHQKKIIRITKNAYKKIDDLREKCDNQKDDISLQALEEINEYLEKTEKQLQMYKG